MADTTALDAFLNSIGKPELQGLGKASTAPKATTKKKTPAAVVDSTGKNDAANAQLLMYQQDAADAADKLHAALNQLKDGTINKDQVASIFANYSAAQDRLYKVDPPSAQKLQATFSTPTAAVGGSSTSQAGPTLRPGEDVLLPAKTLNVDQNGQLLKPDTSSKPTGGTSGTQDPSSPFTPRKDFSLEKPQATKSDSQIASDYGPMGSYALTMGWMKALMLQGAKEGWSTTKFTAEVQNYTDKTGEHPWNKILATVRDSSMAYYSNPQGWGQWYNDKLSILQKSAIAQGEDPSVFGVPIDLSDSKNIDKAFANTTSAVNVFATHYYNNMPDQATIDQYVSNHTTFAKTDQGVYAGILGQNADALKGYASDMGVAATYLPASVGNANTGDYFANAAKNIQDGHTNMEEQQNYIKEQAKAMYQPYAQRISEGMTVRALASPYLNAASNLMEVGGDTIDLGSNTGLGATITKAMQGDQKSSVPLDQFMTQLKQDPAWLKTTNARNSLMDNASSLLQSFGLVVNG